MNHLRDLSGSIHRRAAAAGVAACLFAAAPAAAAPPLEVTTVLTFDRAADETPENLTFDRDGNLYLTLLLAHTVVRLDARGHVDRVILPGTQAAGVAIDPHHPDRLTVAVTSPDPAVAGLWAVPLAAFRGAAAPSRAVVLPAASFPNGITYDRDGTLYVADSTLGRIWRVPHGRDAAEIWLSDPALAPTGATDPVPLPGANGVKLAGGRIWVSNTSSSSILSAPIAPDGSPGPLSVAVDHLFEIDDFLITPRGDIIAALNGANQVVAVDRAGQRTVLEDEAAGARNPSAVALSDCGDLYVTNAAFLFPDGASLQLLTR